MKTAFKSLIILLLSALLIFTITSCINTPNAETFTVKYIASEGGYIDGNDNQAVEKGKDALEVTARAHDGYIFTSWSDGKTGITRQETNVLENITLTANFTIEPEDNPIDIQITYATDGNGTIEGVTSQTIAYGENGSQVTAKPNTGYKFVKWSDNDSTNPVRTESNVTSTINATAIFEKLTYSLNYTPDSNGTIDGSLNQTIAYGDNGSQVTVRPNTGYEFVKWSDDITDNPRTDINVTTSITLTAIFQKIQLQATYIAGDNGTIEGNLSQTIAYGENGSQVTAKPNIGYKFVKWSDDYPTAERINVNVVDNIKVTACFEEISKAFNYNYNNATDNNFEERFELKYNSFYATKLAVPTKERFDFIGWFLDEELTEQVSDENGNIITDYDIFDSGSNALYAKWTNEVLTYKILMVFVTEVQAVLTATDGTDITINYVMSEPERQVCEMIPIMVAKYLNEMLDGYVTFEVDSYFTTVPIGSDSFNRTTDYWKHINYTATAEKISEVYGILDKYRSVITSFSTNDYEGVLHSLGGWGSKKYAQIPIETIFYQYLISEKRPFEKLADVMERINWWDSTMELYLHEFTHTVEDGYGFYSFHEALRYYSYNIDILKTDLQVIKPYLFNKLIIDGERVGVPYEFWKDEKHYTLTYIANEGGSISENAIQHINYSGTPQAVTAIPDEGYRFVKWSDGELNPQRKEYNKISDFTVAAIFEEIKRNFRYYHEPYDYVQLSYFSLHENTLMVPQQEGFIFGGWYLNLISGELFVSDGQGNIIISNKELFGTASHMFILWPKWIPIE